MTRCALDTNVIVYRLDAAAPEKQARAAELVGALAGRLVLPAQVLAETSSVLLRRRPPLPAADVRAYVARARLLGEVVPLTPALVDEALRAVGAYGLSYYDAQIWAAARAARASVLLSEDFQDGQVIEGVRIVNPFAASFDAATL